MKNRNLLLIILGLGGIIILACFACLGIGLIANSSSTNSGTVSQATQEIRPANTVAALPTQTPLQEVVIPTEEPTQTPAPEPTATLVPAPVPEPIVINGTGDTVQNINKWSGPAIIHVVGNASQRHFAVIPYDSSGNRASSLVNTTDYYDGRNLIDFEQNQHTSRLEITTEGEWTIEILPLASARVLQIPGTIDGNGDDVLLLMGGTPDIANISGNPAARHFAVLPYGNGRRFSSMVNTTDPYEGQVLIDREAEVLQVIAEGAWSISIAAAP
ncbi:MAG: hypothetical protein KJ077_50305 [Anaerolineae bacterium]|nr:hypothetical protein [Anaerolineae bacterium]